VAQIIPNKTSGEYEIKYELSNTYTTKNYRRNNNNNNDDKISAGCWRMYYYVQYK